MWVVTGVKEKAMSRIDKKFKEAAQQLSSVAPRIVDGFWISYLNMAGGKVEPIIIPVTFFQDQTPVLRGDFHCLPSAIHISLAAVYQVIETLPHAPIQPEWDSVSYSGGMTKITRSKLQDILNGDARSLSAGLKHKSPSILSACQRMHEAMGRLPSGDPHSKEFITAYDNAKAEFTGEICAAVHHITWENLTPGAEKKTGFLQSLKAGLRLS